MGRVETEMRDWSIGVSRSASVVYIVHRPLDMKAFDEQGGANLSFFTMDAQKYVPIKLISCIS